MVWEGDAAGIALQFSWHLQHCVSRITMIADSGDVAWNWSEVHSYQHGPDMSVAELPIKKCNDHIHFRRITEDKLICFVG